MIQRERSAYALTAAVLLLLLLALLGPAVSQPGHLHGFADQRVLWGVPHALDVLSNLPFAAWGVVGLMCVVGRKGRTSLSGWVVVRGLSALFFVGLLITAGVSAYYHWAPDTARLGLDRLGMVVAFAGLLGLAAAGRVGERAGVALAALVLALGPISVGVWQASGNVLPWAVLQFGGMVVLLGLAWLAPLPGALAVRWGVVIAIYALAKVLEQADPAIYQLSGGVVSGHTLKHVVASMAAWPVVAALLALRSARKIKAESSTPFTRRQAAGGTAKRLLSPLHTRSQS